MNLNHLRKKLAKMNGRRYWRSLEELAETKAFREFLEDEFPHRAAGFDEINRRGFLKLMGASLALAGLQACTQKPLEKIIPYVKEPERLIPGRPLFYASSLPTLGFATGVLVESHMGRPTKIEGNPEHPASLGATDAAMQGAVLSLYDPERSQSIRSRNRPSSWASFVRAMRSFLEPQKEKKGQGIYILAQPFSSPTLATQIAELRKLYPQMHLHFYHPLHRDHYFAASRLAFGGEYETIPHLDKARVIVSFHADFLGEGAGKLSSIRHFTKLRQIRREGQKMSRLYVVETSPTLTGSMADHRLALPSFEGERMVRALAESLGILASSTPLEPALAQWLAILLKDLKENGGESLVLVGENQSPEIQMLAHHINERLGNRGKTIHYIQTPLTGASAQVESLRNLVLDMEAGKVEFLLILGGNPVYDAPSDFAFLKHLQTVPLRVHLSSYLDETSSQCHWHVPESHALETWGDGRAFDGTLTMQQPLVRPLYATKSPLEILALLAERENVSDYQLVRETWQRSVRVLDFEKSWNTGVHDGLWKGSQFPYQVPRLKGIAASALHTEPTSPIGFELQFCADPYLLDGRYANNGWLQELPRPFTQITWDNAALVSPRTATELDVTTGNMLSLRVKDQQVVVPVMILPGQAERVLTVQLGYGRKRAGRIGNHVGADVYPLRFGCSPWFTRMVAAQKLPGRKHSLASTQTHHSMEGRDFVRVFPANQIPWAGPHEKIHEHSLYPEKPKFDGAAWGMVIDLNSCVGCNACMVACQAENNIPVVGKKEVLRGREMHWIRVDRYFEGDLDNPAFHHQPVTCMQCENAPCEPVCPVSATVHSKEGLNEMVYNRCVGTRYCSNNCPYKVRRFNFFQYADLKTESLKALRNPDVTVRERGVMEKCTYCVQRINAARIEAKTKNREIQDGEVVTACQAVCPAEAITFGNLNDPKSKISKLRQHPLHYGLLVELNTRPRTTYLAKLKNPGGGA